MKLTTKSEYSLLALIYIARAGDGYVKIEDICSKYDLSKKYLEQLLISLKQTGYVKAKRGSTGGYALARDPSQITLAGVIRLMDGALAPTLSVSEHFFDHTPLEQEKKVLSVFREIREFVATKLENTTLQDII